MVFVYLASTLELYGIDMDKEWLNKVVVAANAYNDQRLHTNFQEDEVLKFLEFLHKTYGVEYTKPESRHRNLPEKIGK